MSAKSASTQTQSTPVLVATDLIVNYTKDKQINNLNAKIKALKSFIGEQLYVIKKSIEDISVKKAYQIAQFL